MRGGVPYSEWPWLLPASLQCITVNDVEDLKPAINDTIGGLEIAVALQLRGMDEAEAFDNVADQRIPANNQRLPAILLFCILPTTTHFKNAV